MDSSNKYKFHNVTIRDLLLKKGSCKIFWGLVNLLFIYKAATLWTFSVTSRGFPYYSMLFFFFFLFYKKLGLICKEVLWLVHFSTLFSDKPKHWNILAKSRQIVLAVSWIVSVLRGSRWENVQTGQTPESSCWRCWDEVDSSWKLQGI